MPETRDRLRRFLHRSTHHATASHGMLLRGLGRAHGSFQKLASATAAAAVVLLVIGTSPPAYAAVQSPTGSSIATSGVQAAAQHFAANPGASAAVVSRDSYTIINPIPVVEVIVAGTAVSYEAAPSTAIHWALPAGTPRSSEFGPRNVPDCSLCSTFHEGVDFDPGAGTPIHSIADGVVTLVANDSGGLGSHVMIDHIVGGQHVQSVYGHMIAGSIIVAEGQHVFLGQPVGAVGSTGTSTGAHLHFEIRVGGKAIDPIPWMNAHVS